VLRVLAIALVALLAAGCTAKPRGPSASAPARFVTLEVGGMTCQGCVTKIQGHLARVPGVKRAEVSLADQRARVLADASVADTALTGAVRRAGPEYLGIVLTR